MHVIMVLVELSDQCVLRCIRHCKRLDMFDRMLLRGYKFALAISLFLTNYLLNTF